MTRSGRIAGNKGWFGEIGRLPKIAALTLVFIMSLAVLLPKGPIARDSELQTANGQDVVGATAKR